MPGIKSQLNKELENILQFWLNTLYNKNSGRFICEYSVDGKVNHAATQGSMFYGRILYGVSAACRQLQNKTYKTLADSAFQILHTEFKNPQGGYYWAIDEAGNYTHDSENINLAQAFILYGLVEYAQYSGNPDALTKAVEQYSFICSTLRDNINGGYLDDFDMNWSAEPLQTKALGTHLHLLEAFVKLYQLTRNNELINQIEELIDIILTRFITPHNFECLHRLTPDWQPLPNFVWAGHEAECSWILCHSAKIIGNNDLVEKCKTMAKGLMNKVITHAYDTQKGGLFNDLKNNKPTEAGKIWWPQAEFVLGLFNYYKITGDNNYKEFALNQIKYISENFIHSTGEWYTEVIDASTPNTEIPLVHFWKSLYHNIRYYIELNMLLT